LLFAQNGVSDVIFDSMVLAKGDQYGRCLFMVALWYYITARPQRDIAILVSLSERLASVENLVLRKLLN
jgi:hypothetical protein